jgi:hypothetical protein
MARFHPGVVLRLHHMTVRACSRIVRQVGISLGINKGVSRKPNGHSQNDGGKKTDCDRALHEGLPIRKQEKNTLQHRSRKAAREGLSVTAAAVAANWWPVA